MKRPEGFERTVYGPIWAADMQTLYDWYDQARVRLDNAKTKGLESYREVLTRKELHTLLKQLQKQKDKPPKFKGRKEVTNDFKKAIECEIKFREIDLKLFADPLSKVKAARASWWRASSSDMGWT